MDNKFFTFIQPYISFIDKGHFFKKPFRWLYSLLAVLELLFPIYMLYKAIDMDVFEGPAKAITAFIIIWFIVAFASWITFQIWWDRKDKIITTSGDDDDFFAVPALAHFLQTLGEAFGTRLGIAGFGIFLVLTILFGNEASYAARSMGIPGAPGVWAGVTITILMPILGFVIIIGTRYFAELSKALCCIANNTKNSEKGM